MPMRDGRGPRWGGGPMSGWGMGPCARGSGFGRGYNRFRRMTKEDEIEMLKAEKEVVEQDLKDIDKRLGELK